MRTKLNNLLQKWPQGGIATASWLESLGIYRQLRKQYIDSHWVDSLGYGIFKRAGDKVSWEGALHALQYQLKKDIHLGGKSALEFRGLAHFVPLHESRIFLFSNTTKALPRWFSKDVLGIEVNFYNSLFLNTDVGIETREIAGFPVKVSTPERAFFEVLQLAPHKQSLKECKYLAENLRSLRPQIVQKLLESCTSIKVKRLFLVFADHEQFACLKHLKLEGISLGSGSRNLVPGGYLHSKYKITLPKDLFENEG